MESINFKKWCQISTIPIRIGLRDLPLGLNTWAYPSSSLRSLVEGLLLAGGYSSNREWNFLCGCYFVLLVLSLLHFIRYGDLCARKCRGFTKFEIILKLSVVLWNFPLPYTFGIYIFRCWWQESYWLPVLHYLRWSIMISGLFLDLSRGSTTYLGWWRTGWILNLQKILCKSSYSECSFVF